MPRFKKKPDGRGQWQEQNMKDAVEQVMSRKLTTRQAALYFNVPKSSLNDRVVKLKKGIQITMSPDMGHFKPTFSSKYEEMLVQYLQDADSRLMPFTRDEFCKFAFDLAEKLKLPHRFNTQKKQAGIEFYYSFLKRHPELRLRKPESTSIARAVGFNRPQVLLFYEKLKYLNEKYNFPPHKIFNADETGVSCVHKNTFKVLSVKGKKQVGKLTSGERGRNVTLLFCFNATGDLFVPPLFIFPRQKINERLKENAPPGSIFEANSSGWITGPIFFKWLQHFVKIVKPSSLEPVLLILDGHASHKELEVIKYAKDNFIHLLSIPPHTSNKLQPLDRTFMKPFKNAYDSACTSWMRMHRFLRISDYDIAGLVEKAYVKTSTMQIAKSGFACCGIVPYNPEIFKDDDYMPAEGLSIPHDTYQELQNNSEIQENIEMPQNTPINSQDNCEILTEKISPNIIEEIMLLPKDSTDYFNLNHTPDLSIIPDDVYDAILADFHTPEKTCDDYVLQSPNKPITVQNPSKILITPQKNILVPKNNKQQKLQIMSNKLISSEPSTSAGKENTPLKEHFGRENTPLKEHFARIVETIYPTQDALQRRVASRKRKSTKSEIWTSTPFKKDLEEKHAQKLKKITKKQEKQKQRNDKTNKVDTKKIKKVLDWDDNKKKKNSTGKKRKEKTTFCGKCSNFYKNDEDWVQCLQCHVWYHVYCVFNGDDPYFVCENCSSDISD